MEGFHKPLKKHAKETGTIVARFFRRAGRPALAQAGCLPPHRQRRWLLYFIGNREF
jgi:hypothetical protein